MFNRKLLICTDTLSASSVRIHNQSMSVTEDAHSSNLRLDFGQSGLLGTEPSKKHRCREIRHILYLPQPTQRMGCAEVKQRRAALSMALGVGKSALLAQNCVRSSWCSQPGVPQKEDPTRPTPTMARTTAKAMMWCRAALRTWEPARAPATAPGPGAGLGAWGDSRAIAVDRRGTEPPEGSPIRARCW
jgi:hypothetical protein